MNDSAKHSSWRRASRATTVMGAAALILPLWLSGAPSAAKAHPAASPSNVDWRYYGNDLANTRFQDVDRISQSNVAKLQPAWVFHTGLLNPGSSFENSPIEVNGTLFVSTGHDDVFALNAATGAQKWAYHPEAQMPPLTKLYICCGAVSRGVAYGDGLIFLARLDGKLVALNARTGAVAWQATVARYQDGYTMTMAPQFADGEVIVGLSGAEFETRGAAFAYNARTGHLLWRFNTTQPATWTGTSWKTGGGSVWGNPTVDPRLGLVYVGTGNAGPDLYGGARNGKNLYTASLVALDLRTGHLRWAFQEIHHDLWDYDGPQPPVLFNVQMNGRSYPAIGHCSKDGNYFILNRATGHPIFPVKEVPVPTRPAWQDPWPTQPKSSVQPITPLTITGPVGPGITPASAFTPPQQQQYAIQPGGVGGCSWAASAYSPRTDDIYYTGIYFPFVYESSPGSGPTNTGGSFEVAPIPGVQVYSVIGATSTRTGKVAWSTKVAQANSASMAVAGNVLFYGTDNGVFHAVSAATGAPLWSFNGMTVPDAGGADAPPAIYVVHGREYVVEAFGGNSNDRASGRSPVGDAVIAFALPAHGSSGALATASQGAAAHAGPALAAPVTAADLHVAARGSARPAIGSWGSASEVPGTAGLNRDGDAEITSVSCAGAGSCSAGGDYEDASVHLHAFVVTETAGTWGAARQVPGIMALDKGGSAWIASVSCTTAGNCSAGGVYEDAAHQLQAFVVSQVGGTWGTATPLPGLRSLNRGGNAEITSVSCATAGDCGAGGYFADALGRRQAFVASERHGTWGPAIEVPGTRTLNRGGDAEITSVSCAKAGYCNAGGNFEDASRHFQAIVVSERHGTWGAAMKVPGTQGLNKGGNAQVTSVSCTSAGNCGAGGYYADAANQRQAFVVSETGGAWGTAIELPGSAALNQGGNAEVSSVSCSSAGNCSAGGSYVDASFYYQVLVASETGGTWSSAIEVPGTAALNYYGVAEVNAVSCSSAGNCSAGGYYADSSFHLQAFVISQVGGTWGTAIEVPGTAALNQSGNAEVNSLSCSHAGTCAAGGPYWDGSADYQAFIISGT